MSAFLYSYNAKSAGGKDLAAQLAIRRIRHERSTFKGGIKKTVLNWGSSELKVPLNGARVLNKPEAVALCANKLEFFRAMDVENGPRIPRYTTDRNEALGWIAEGATVCIRTMLRASSGEGLIIVSSANIGEFVNAPLYVRYIPKKDEFRVHIVAGEVIDVQRKALRSGVNAEDADWKVRNLANGFIFARNDIEVPPDVIEQARKSFALTGLDFGAFDIIYQEKKGRAFVLEVNTAPGLMGTTLENYTRAIKGLL